MPKRNEPHIFFNKKEVEEIREAYYKLQGEAKTAQGWAIVFARNFQSHLDAAAWRQIEAISKVAAFKATISPYAVLDMLIIFYWSFKMMGQLCVVYNSRTGFVGTVYSLYCVFLNTFFAGKLNDFETESRPSLR